MAIRARPRQVTTLIPGRTFTLSLHCHSSILFFFNETATTEIYTLSLHDALPIYLHADPVRLAQVFSNLLNNSCKYTEPGGRIWLTAERQGSDVVVSVKDNGIGIPPDMLPCIFDMFTQVDRALERSQGGLGIGLTLVKRLVEMHGGSVEVRSAGVG